jgi:hypothetical protein
VKLLLENWRKYLNEDDNADISDEWMVWAREIIQPTIGFQAAWALDRWIKLPEQFSYAWPPSINSFPKNLQHMSYPYINDIHDKLFRATYDDGFPESLKKKILEVSPTDNWPPERSEEQAAFNITTNALRKQLIKEVADFGTALEKIWADPDLAQFKEKLLKRTVEDWRAAKALAESIV